MWCRIEEEEVVSNRRRGGVTERRGEEVVSNRKGGCGVESEKRMWCRKKGVRDFFEISLDSLAGNA